MTVRNLGRLVLERGLEWGGTEGCTAMLVQMCTDDDKNVLEEYIQGPCVRSSKQIVENCSKKKIKDKKTYGRRGRVVRWLDVMIRKNRLLRIKPFRVGNMRLWI